MLRVGAPSVRLASLNRFLNGLSAPCKMGVQPGNVGRVDLPFYRLHVVALLNPARHHPVRLGHECPLQMRQCRLLIPRSHIHPNTAPCFGDRIRFDLDPLFESGVSRFGGHLHTIAVYIELPAVIDTPQSAIFIAAKKHAGAPVGTDVVSPAVIRQILPARATGTYNTIPDSLLTAGCWSVPPNTYAIGGSPEAGMTGWMGVG